MSMIPEPGRQAAHVLLDAVYAYESELDGELNTEVLNLALQRLNEVDDAVVLRIDDNDDPAAVEVSNLVGGTIVTMRWLAGMLARERGVDLAEVINDARAFIDE